MERTNGLNQGRKGNHGWQHKHSADGWTPVHRGYVKLWRQSQDSAVFADLMPTNQPIASWDEVENTQALLEAANGS